MPQRAECRRVFATARDAGGLSFVFEALISQILSVYTYLSNTGSKIGASMRRVRSYYVVLVRVVETSVALAYYYIVFANSN